MKRKLIVIVIGALALGACASDPELLALRETPSFQVGFSDGCLTAGEEDKSFSTKSARDAYAFENDKAYRSGWRQGYLECTPLTPDPNNGGRVLGERNEY